MPVVSVESSSRTEGDIEEAMHTTVKYQRVEVMWLKASWASAPDAVNKRCGC